MTVTTLVPFVDLKAQFRAIRAEVVPRMMEVMEEATFILGPDVAAFEENFATYVGARYCVGVESGTAALQFALEALGIGDGDDVIVPANTYIASALAVSAAGARPVLVDADAKLSNRYRALRSRRDVAHESDHAGASVRSSRADGCGPGVRAPARTLRDRRCESSARRALERSLRRQLR